jgi:hypothetical protein
LEERQRARLPELVERFNVDQRSRRPLLPRLDPERALDALDLGFGPAQGRFEE